MTPADLGEWFDLMAAGLVLYARQWAGAGAEDVVQEAFVRLAAQKKTPPNVKAWLLLTVKRAALDAAKSSRRRQARDHAAGEMRLRLFERAEAAAAVAPEDVQTALAELLPEEREAITLRIWNGATFEEAAAVMRLPVTTIFQRYRSGLERLRARWELPCRKS